MTRPIRWLHLSDLHMGCRGEALWWQVYEELRKSVRVMARKLGPPDLLILSGDLANKGTAEEFALFDRFLDDLLAWLAEEGAGEPLVFAVPGNHDLLRPKGIEAVMRRALGDYFRGTDDPDFQEIHDALWKARDASFVAPLFEGYQAWFERRILPRLAERAKVRVSHFPGDLTVEVDVPGAFPLVLVGLNSTWQQYASGDAERRLLLPAEQFHAALGTAAGASPLAVFEGTPRAFLVMHHPPSWLSPRGRRIFDESIYLPGRFDLCLHGHLHAARSDGVAISGGLPRFFFQAPSLFGLEYWGSERESRTIGYAWGSLDESGEVRLWPLERRVRGDGSAAFVHDQLFPEAPDGSGVSLWPVSGKVDSPAAADFSSCLEALVDRTSHINISGISSAGSVKGALRHPIERLYIPLRSQGVARGLGVERSAKLSDLLPLHHRLLLEGQPGAGKTTFLHLVACMLARDALGVPCAEGDTWRRRHLGMNVPGKVPIPVLVRLADLADQLAEAGTVGNRDGRQRLLDLLAAECEANDDRVSREEWAGLFERGEAMLLLDGLDEVADPHLRERLFAIFRDASKHWQTCPMVVASRPIRTAALHEMGFHTATLEPFSEHERTLFVEAWVAALYAAPSAEELGGAGERYRLALQGAIAARPRIRRLATNPVMLTCLCVVHWNEGRLPEGRSRVYRAVIRWLIAARTAQREDAGFTNRFALRAFACLALAMLSSEGGKRSIIDLEAGAVAIDPVVRREFPELESEDRRHKAREWLRFEGLGSGIVEEIAVSRVRFWHLTFQEFLAALQLAWRGDGEDPEADWWPLVLGRLDDAQWRETVELFPGCLLDEGGEGRVDTLLDRVLALRGDGAELATEARVAAVVGRLLQPLSAYQYRARPEIAKAYEEALGRSMAIFSKEGAAEVPVKVRIEVAEALGRGGDPRLAPERDKFLKVPGLEMRLGKYPVTVEEYQRFVELRGYEEERWWEVDGWALKEKKGWEAPLEWDDQLATPNRPVVGVSWWEATAFTRWSSVQHGKEMRLPTEAEWERAATAAKGKYPWGEVEPNEELANLASELGKPNVGRPTPVGIYPAGDGPYGHCDLAGNVWEWCQDAREELEGEVTRGLRGGGWHDASVYLRSAIRLGHGAWSRNVALGFRVVVVPPSC